VAHHSQEFSLGPIGGICCLPCLSGFAHRTAKLFVGQGELVSELASFPGLVLQLAGLSLKEMIALFEGSQARSGYLALA